MTEEVATTPSPAPLWSPEMLRDAMMVVYGPNKTRTGPDLRVAAEALSRAPRTVRRWLRRSDESGAAAIPADRFAVLLESTRPRTLVLEDEESKLVYHREMLTWLSLPRQRGIPEGHRTAGWLEPHVVTVVDLPAVPLRLATFTRVDRVTIPPTTVRVTNRGMCPVVAYATCPNRYAAMVVKILLLRAVDPWRVVAPPTAEGMRASTETWLAAAPLPDLQRLVRTVV